MRKLTPEFNIYAQVNIRLLNTYAQVNSGYLIHMRRLTPEFNTYAQVNSGV